jgi:hypothetical protein
MVGLGRIGTCWASRNPQVKLGRLEPLSAGDTMTSTTSIGQWRHGRWRSIAAASMLAFTSSRVIPAAWWRTCSALRRGETQLAGPQRQRRRL